MQSILKYKYKTYLVLYLVSLSFSQYTVSAGLILSKFCNMFFTPYLHVHVEGGRAWFTGKGVLPRNGIILYVSMNSEIQFLVCPCVFTRRKLLV